jgi:hypothetical protein
MRRAIWLACRIKRKLSRFFKRWPSGSLKYTGRKFGNTHSGDKCCSDRNTFQ